MLTQKILKELLHYFPDTGDFTWLATRGKARVGAKAGYLSKAGYIQLGVNGKLYFAHRLAFLYMTGEFPELEVDHIDHCPSNNAWSNLREVSHQENGRNQSISKSNKSGYNGVYWCVRSKKWHTQIAIDGKTVHLGYHAELENAVIARDAANIEYGFHENHGAN
jgi:hypothetical protein